MHLLLRRAGLIAVILGAASACLSSAEREAPAADATDSEKARVQTNGTEAADRAPDTSWVVVARPVIVAFHPFTTNELLETDEGLATALDDLAYHLGTAMDSLVAQGFVVRYQPGDTVKIFAAAAPPFVFVRSGDSADVGYVFADSIGRRAIVYGVRSHLDLVDYAKAFLRDGAVPRTP